MSDGQLKILIVDDELGRELLTQLLEEEYTVFSATNGGQCMEIVRSEQPDMMLIEPTLPLIEGYDLISEVRQSEAGRDIPILAITAAGMPDDEERAREAGCNEFILKPIEEDSLKALIKERMGG